MKLFFPFTFDLFQQWRGGYNLIFGALSSLPKQVSIEFLYSHSAIPEQPDIRKIGEVSYFSGPETLWIYLKETLEFEKQKSLLLSLGHCGLWHTNMRRVIYIPDFQHEYLPQNFSEKELSSRRLHYQVESATADGVWMSSRSVQSDLVRFVHNLPKNQLVLPFPSLKKWPKKMEPFQQLIDKNFILCVSQNWPHKNIENLIQAWKKIQNSHETEWELVLAGNGLPESLQMASRCWVFSNINEQNLVWLYQNAKFFVLPSYFEGWSTPVEEAICSQLPLLLSDISILREQASMGSVFFNPASVDSLYEKLCLLMNDQNMLITLKSEVSKNKRHTIDEYGEKLFKFFEGVLK